MKRAIVTITLFVLSGTIWIVYNTNKNTRESQNKIQPTPVSAVSLEPSKKEEEIRPQEAEVKDVQTDSQAYSNWSNDSSQAASPFPPPSVEKIGNITQRTIHMGVRQWEWVPARITAEYGEKVILIMHNADVTHSISIPELNVKQSIPDDGAVVQFVASKRGTFLFLCDNPCGKGHDQMRGEIIIT